MNIGPLLTSILLLLLLGFTHGCVTLPEYGRPRFIAPGIDAPGGKAGFTYRQLERKDFQAKSLPAESRQHSDNIGAQSCVNIRPSKDAKITIVQSQYENTLLFAGTLTNVSFEAVFVPDCSWWNPEIPRSREKYVLQHEQVHFGLAELAARQLTREAENEMHSYLAIGNDYNEVQEEIMAKLRDMGQKTMEISLAEHTAFDEDTSLFYDPQAQKSWLNRVNLHLADKNNR